MPRYVIDELALRRNLEILKDVSDRAGVKILLAQKAFSCAAVYPLCAKYLAGTTASSLFEAERRTYLLLHLCLMRLMNCLVS